MNIEIHPADWSIPYPDDCKPGMLPRFFSALTHVEHEWDSFPWHLADELVNLLQNPEASFEYLHLTTFFRARAAMLALGDHVLDHDDLFEALSRLRAQAGGIYRAHLLAHVNAYLEQQNLKRLPDCSDDETEKAPLSERVTQNRLVFQNLVRIAEAEYLKTLNFISVATSLDEEVAGHSVGYWVKGAEMPKGRSVRVRVRKLAGEHIIRPARDEVKRLIHADRPLKKILVKPQGEFDSLNAEIEEDGEVRHKACATKDSQAESCASAMTKGGKPEVRVIGDFRAIILGRGRKMCLSRKHKRRAFLRAVHRRCMAGNVDTFYWQEVVDDHNAEFPGSHQAHRRIKSDRIDDIFKGQKAEFQELFEILDRATGHLRLKVRFAALCNLILAIPLLGAEDLLAAVAPVICLQ